MNNINTDASCQGALKISVTSVSGRPVPGAVADIFTVSDSGTPVFSLTTNEDGQTETVTPDAPPASLSSSPGVLMPYAEYNLVVSAEEYLPVTVNGINVFCGVLSIQNVILPDETGFREVFNIGPNVLYGDYPAKIPEAEIKPVGNTGEIVLNEVIIPEFIVVHDGLPYDSSAPDYYVPFTDYIKNVASSEIYPTWPEETIKANILAIISFTLNRVYTEWYRNQGYNFTITSSTAYDHKWINNRNIFDSISLITDEIFAEYISRPGIKQPILTQYCDGKRTTCTGMSQWGSKDLGDAGYSALEILRSYYGSDIYINTAAEISGVPVSWPGYLLEIGSSGSAVRTIQEQLSLIRETYTNIPFFEIDGIYGEDTLNAVKKFQEIFNLNPSGLTDYSTWYEISRIYVALAGLSS